MKIGFTVVEINQLANLIVCVPIKKGTEPKWMDVVVSTMLNE